MTSVALNVYNNSIKSFILSLTKTWMLASATATKKKILLCSWIQSPVPFCFPLLWIFLFLLLHELGLSFDPRISAQLYSFVSMLNAAIHINIHENVSEKKREIIHKIHSQIQVEFDSTTKATKKNSLNELRMETLSFSCV